jgi:hypothetical protein
MKYAGFGKVWWFMPSILYTPDAEIRRILVQGQHWEKS